MIKNFCLIFSMFFVTFKAFPRVLGVEKFVNTSQHYMNIYSLLLQSLNGNSIINNLNGNSIKNNLDLRGTFEVDDNEILQKIMIKDISVKFKSLNLDIDSEISVSFGISASFINGVCSNPLVFESYTNNCIPSQKKAAFDTLLKSKAAEIVTIVIMNTPLANFCKTS